MVREIRVVVLERHEVARLGLEKVLESVDEPEPRAPAPGPDGAPRLVLVSGGDRDDTAPGLTVTADGYVVLRDVTAESLRAALLTVLSGQTRLPDEVTMYLLDAARGDGPGRPGGQGRMRRLTPREDEVLELVVSGCSNQEIATELGLSVHGAKRHVSSILAKFDSPSRSHLVSRVLQARAGQALGA